MDDLCEILLIFYSFLSLLLYSSYTCANDAFAAFGDEEIDEFLAVVEIDFETKFRRNCFSGYICFEMLYFEI